MQVFSEKFFILCSDCCDVAGFLYTYSSIPSLMKDMTGKEDQFRGPAIRALCSVTDVGIRVLLACLR